MMLTQHIHLYFTAYHFMGGAGYSLNKMLIAELTYRDQHIHTKCVVANSPMAQIYDLSKYSLRKFYLLLHHPFAFWSCI